MATKTQPKDDPDQLASPQDLYDREFNSITDPANYGKTAKDPHDKKLSKEELKEREERAKYGTPPSISEHLKTPEQKKAFEDSIGLYKPGAQKRLHGLRFYQRHKKAIIGGGAGGGIAMVLLSVFFFVAPAYRIPSAMSLITDAVGHEAENIVEHRAERMIIGYLIEKAGGSPGNFVIRNSLLGTLWATFQTNRLEDKIFKQTGIRLLKNADGSLRITHDGRDLQGVNCSGRLSREACIDAVTKILKGSPDSEVALRKIVRLSVPAWRFLKASKMARYLRIKTGVRFATIEKDKTKSDEENKKNLTKKQIDEALNKTLDAAENGFDCITSGKGCESLNPDNEPIESPPSDHNLKDIDESTNEVSDSLKNAAQEAEQEVIESSNNKVRSSLSDKIVEKLLTKLVGQATAKAVVANIPILGWVDTMAAIRHMQNTAAINHVASRIPATLTAIATESMYAQWLGYGDNIKAGTMDILFVGLLTQQMNSTRDGSTVDSAAWKFSNGKTDLSTAIPVADRVNNNVSNPLENLMAQASSIDRFADPLEWWYDTVGFVFRESGEALSWLSSPITKPLMNLLYDKVISKDTVDNFVKTMFNFVLNMSGLSVDPMATGAKLFNELYTGADSAWNEYVKTNLGGRAISGIVSGLHLVGEADPQPAGYSVADSRTDMALLPLKDRLFSLDEPHSLVNEAIMAAPTSVPDLFNSLLRQTLSLPGMFASAITAHSYAADPMTPEQRAAVDGVRQYGASEAELDQDFTEQVATQDIAQGEPTCPANNPEAYFNACQADKEIIGSLMCMYTDCPEFQTGDLMLPDTKSGLASNLKQLLPTSTTAWTKIW